MVKDNEEKQIPGIMINNQYIKDLSLEIPHAPHIFKEMNKQPKINIDVEVKNEVLEDNFFNVSLHFHIEGKIEDKVLFILELVYSGVVSLNVPKEHIEPVLLVEVPRMFFPFARSVITNTLVDGGLPPFMLNPIDFGSLYQSNQSTKN